MILKNNIEKLMRQENLPFADCEAAMHAMLDENVNPLQISAFLVLLRTKTETADELMAAMTAFKKKMIVVPTQHRVLDIVGTGGDGVDTVNISTGSAILAASCGVKIAKHGNRAVSSLTGSADVLEALGVKIDLAPGKISACIDEIGIGFCFSPNFHPAMRALRRLRKELNVPTTFNILGPLLNPANPAHFLLGVYDEALMPSIAETLQLANTERSLVVHGCGLDEISCVGPAKMIEVTKKSLTASTLDPAVHGLSYCDIADLRGGDANTNAQLLLNTFAGKRSAIADTLILNAAVALFLYGLYPSIADAIPHAEDNLYDSSALNLLNNWIEFSHDE